MGGEIMTILTTCCYLKKDGKTLLLHRTKKKNDINEGKFEKKNLPMIA